MRICIVGAGAIGSYLGGKLALLGEEVTLIARGPHLEAMKRNGLTMQMAGGSKKVAVPALATGDMNAAGPQDIVIITVKAQHLSAIAPRIQDLCGPNTMVIFAQNGIPWWYFHKHGYPYEGLRIESVDPSGQIEAQMDIGRVIGCVLYVAAELIEPGVIRSNGGNRLILGELDGSTTGRLQTLSQAFAHAGFETSISVQIRTEIWMKLWGNLAFNPISALTRATLVEMCQHSLVRELAKHMMEEGQKVAEKLGVQFALTIEQRIAGAEAVGAHKTSMLQDIEAGRLTEVDTILGAIIELAKLTATPTPYMEAIYASVKLLETHRQVRDTEH